MHIVLCTHNVELEGAPLQLFHLAKLLQTKGHSVVLCTPKRGPLLSLVKKNAIAYHVMPRLYHSNLTQEYIQKNILPLKPDVVMVNTILGARIIHMLHECNPHLPTTLSIHESEFHEIMDKNPHITPNLLSLAHAVIFVSHATKVVYEEWDTGNMHVIHNSIHIKSSDIQQYQSQKNQLRDVFGIPQKSTVVTLIGSICPRKGQKEFIASALHLMDRLPQDIDIRFVIAGKIGRGYDLYLKEALQPVIDRGLRDRFYVLPENQKPMKYFACTDIYVCNSFIESFPLVILEAMACGLPIAASKTYGVAEQLTDKETGLLHLPGHISQLTENLYTLIKDKTLAAQLGENAKKTVREQFSQEKMVHAYNNLLTSLI